MRMMGIPTSSSPYIYRDNMLAIHNTSKPESTLKKICNAIAYHVICKSVMMRESLTGHIRSEENPSDLQTMVVTGEKRKNSAISVI